MADRGCVRGINPSSNIPVLLLDGNWPNTHHVARALVQVPGLDVHIACERPEPSFDDNETIRPHVVPHEPHTAAFRNGIVSLAQQVQARVLVATSTGTVAAMSGYRDELEPRLEAVGCTLAAVPPTQAQATISDKGAFGRFLTDHALPMPTTVDLADTTPQQALADGTLAYPFLVKPKQGFAGGGIFAVRGEAELARKGGDVDWSTMLAQDLVPGYDIDCSVLCDRGEIVAQTVQRTRLSRYAYGPPSLIQFVRDDGVVDATRRLMKALRWHGVAHVDLRHDARDGSPKIIEVNGRYWASVDGSVAAGVNFPKLHVLRAVDLCPSAPPAVRGWSLCPPPPSETQRLAPANTAYWRSGLKMVLSHPRTIARPLLQAWRSDRAA